MKELQTLEANSKYLFILLCTIVLLFIEAQQGSIYIQYFPCALNSNCLFYHVKLNMLWLPTICVQEKMKKAHKKEVQALEVNM